MKLIKRVLGPLETATSKYHGAIGSAEEKIAEFVEFDFGIEWQPSDGWTIVAVEEAHVLHTAGIGTNYVAPLSNCLSIIEEMERLGIEEFKRVAM